MAGSAISALAGRADVGRVARALGDVASRGNVRILPAFGTQRLDVVRIGKESHIENKVGFPWQATTIRKRRHGHRHLGPRIKREMLSH